MGIISMEKVDHLYWLGRYTERVYTTLRVFFHIYDKMIEQPEGIYAKYCERLNIPNIYTSNRQFVMSYLFNEDNPDSLRSNMERAYDNAVVLRDELSTTVLSYVHLAVGAFEGCRKTTAPLLELQQVIDYLYAFWGCVDDRVDKETGRNLMKCGKYMERLGIKDYRLRAAARFQSADQTSADCYMLWEQTVDDIPITWLEITDNMDAGRRSVYNSSQGFNHDDIRQIGSFGEGTRMIMHVTDGRLTDLEVCLVEPTELYETRRIVTAEKAFWLVEEVYQQKSEETDPRLELAELQYKCLERDGQMYLYPVWVFGIAEYDAEWAKADEDESWRNQWLEPGDYYHYYIIDAFSGELLLDPGLE